MQDKQAHLDQAAGLVSEAVLLVAKAWAHASLAGRTQDDYTTDELISRLRSWAFELDGLDVDGKPLSETVDA